MPEYNLNKNYDKDVVQDIKPTQLPERFREEIVVPSLRIGAGSKGLVINSEGIYSGARKYDDAEFSFPLTGKFIYRSSLSQSTVPSFGNGDQIVNQITATNTSGKNILPIYERVVYVGSRTAANILPGGSAIVESQWQVIGDFNSHVKTNGESVALNEIANWRYIRNISAGTVTLYIDVYLRYIINTS